MKTITLNVKKKNRKYFACQMSSGYKAKLLIDANSENIELGEHELLVDDISVRSKYGTDLIYKLSTSVEKQQDAGICSLRHERYNKILVDECKKLGGAYDGENWIFSDLVEDKVEELDDIWNSPMVAVEIKAIESIFKYHAPVTFLGYTVARARGRDSGASLGDGVSLIEGQINSGGSMKNWTSRVEEGSVLRLRVPRKVLDENRNDESDWEIKELKKEGSNDLR